jgi:uncharacterized repeat protein (TIGR03803 family)
MVPCPIAPLTSDGQGNLYGTTLAGGSYSGGTVFKMSPNGDEYPRGGLVMDAAGNLYGTTSQGGGHDGFYCYYGGCGTIFKLTPSAKGVWTESIVHIFNSDDGTQPFAGLIQDSAGNLYGTAQGGDTYGAGVLFEVVP